ncbi:hypothetical protein [Asticcacaulis sp.]|uniref:hypothetical protein n=1 Tax=Asticcacaulis sp. TaxID=1872648 RepID=UPI0026107783|nr:hypothetical protein [Asticcacaulis sp.]
MVHERDQHEYTALHAAFRHLETTRHNSFSVYLTFSSALCAVIFTTAVGDIGKFILSCAGFAISRSLEVYVTRMGKFSHYYYNRMKYIEGKDSGIGYLDDKARMEDAYLIKTTGFGKRIAKSFLIGKSFFAFASVCFLIVLSPKIFNWIANIWQFAIEVKNEVFSFLA